MTQHNPILGNDTGLPPISDLETIRRKTAETKARIAQYCDWFAINPPKVRVGPKGILFTDELNAFLDAEGVCLDWLFRGDVRALVVAWRKDAAQKNRVAATVKNLTDRQKRAFVAGLRAYTELGVPFDDAMAGIWATVGTEGEQ